MKQKYERNRSVVFFAPDVTDVSTIKRAEAFRENGFHITVLGFRRSRYNNDYDPRWPYIELGRTLDRNYLQRSAMLLRAVFLLFIARRYVQRGARYYARNIDQLMLAIVSKFLFRRDAAIVYEVLDIQPAFTGAGLYSRLLRLLERFCLRQVSLLVVSSPAFVHEYYEPMQRYRGNWFLLENKLQASAVAEIEPAAASDASPSSYKWTVSYVGLIRGQKTFDLITRLAEKLRGEVLFKFHGILTTVDEEAFREALANNKNMIYCGDYVNPRDLAKVYEGADFVWALDLENMRNNSRWLLPCRLYEAGALGFPCLAVRDFEVGRKIDALDIGWTFKEPFEETLVEFFRTVTDADVARKRERIHALPDAAFVTSDDTSSLCRFVADDTVMAKRNRHVRRRPRARRLILPTEESADSSAP
ncbi:MAG: hypothetical protein K8R18_15220 [Parvibaculum sp.]|uniref:hypothetical protein n=1 Tax=Parvibaculum sp. TaxID=2024848 RepID=UPI0025ECE459|nr:hypothetical protein [Parvibaculum sp.]MCE9650969.1 hypothetical protein [Parvibaculum sp.]